MKAAMQCKQHCQELAHRCRKDNTFFRDVGFEMDQDFTEGNRGCLDGLVLEEPDTEEESPTLDPKIVQGIRDIFADPHFSDATEQDLGMKDQNGSN